MTKFYMGIDCGKNGAISIISGSGELIKVVSIPVVKTKQGKKIITSYDIPSICSILEHYSTYNILIGIEKQAPRPLEGTISCFTNGYGFGLLQGILHAYFAPEVIQIISPTTWKKHYQDIFSSNTDIQILKDTINTDKENLKIIKNFPENKRDKQQISAIDKRIRSNRQKIKNITRFYCQKLYPDNIDDFKKVKDDGKADSVLIANFIKEIEK